MLTQCLPALLPPSASRGWVEPPREPRLLGPLGCLLWSGSATVRETLTGPERTVGSRSAATLLCVQLWILSVTRVLLKAGVGFALLV